MPHLAALADELGDLEAEILPLTPKIARADLLRKTIRAAYADRAEDQSFSIEGERFTLAIGAKADERRVNLAMLFKAVSAKVFLQLCGVTLRAVEAAVPALVAPELAAAVIFVATHVGTRPLKIFEKATQPKLRRAV